VAVCRKCWRNRRIESSNRFRLPFDYEDLNADTPDEE
jgi:hypothetical protein